MKILIADKLAPEGEVYLSSQDGVEVTTQIGLAGDELADVLRQFDGVVIRSAVKITPDVFDALASGPSSLRGIARAGVGVDNIHLPSATSRGIAVMNSASASTITTAEHAFALMISLARNVAQAHATMSQGGWDRSKYVGAQLHGRTLGVVGMGRIGQTMAQRALAFGMTVIGFDPMHNAGSMLEGKVQLVGSFDELIEMVDMVSFHVPKTERTAGMLSTDQFGSAKPGLLVVNAARGGIVDEAALLVALDSGQCGGAAIDVYDQEPPPEDSPLRSHPKIITTPHLGASTVEAQEAVAVDACRVLYQYLDGQGLEGAVNAGGLQLDLTDHQERIVDLARRMVMLLATVSDPGLSSVQVTLRGETLAGRADTIGRFALAELLNQHLEQPVNVINAGVIADERGIELLTTIAADHGEDRISIEVQIGDRTHFIEGAMYADDMPRITSLDGFHMDMIPADHMILLTNADEPGRIGEVGKIFGDSDVNIAEMVIARKTADAGESVAMMILKLDEAPSASVVAALRGTSGILNVATVALPSA